MERENLYLSVDPDAAEIVRSARGRRIFAIAFPVAPRVYRLHFERIRQITVDPEEFFIKGY